VPQCAIHDDQQLLSHMRFAPYIQRIAAAILARIRRRAQGPILAVHIRRKGKRLRVDTTSSLGKQDDSLMGKMDNGSKAGRNAQGKVALFNFQDKDIFFPVSDVALGLRQYAANHSIGAIYMATNRMADLPQYEGNGTGAPLFCLSSVDAMRREMQDETEFSDFFWDNFIVSIVEEEIGYQAEHFIGSVRSTWSDNVMWWRSANADKEPRTTGIVQTVLTALDREWTGQIHDERELARDEVQGGLIHKDWKEKRNELIRDHNRQERSAKRKAAACRDNDAAASAAAKSFGLSIANCAEGLKMGLCAEPAAKQVCPKSCDECPS